MKRLYKIANGVFLAAFVAVLSVTLVGVFAYEYLSEGETDCYLAEAMEELGFGKSFSNLEGRTYQDAPELSKEALRSGAFQDSAEQYLSDSVPHRDSVLLANAALQRLGIEVASKPFGYQVYETYYGSKHIYDAVNDTVTERLARATPEEAELYETASETYNAFAGRHPDLDVVMYRVDHTGSSVNNPSYGLTSGVVDSNFLSEHFYNLLDDGITVLDGVCDSVEESLALYYRSDHHWNIDGGFAAYEQIASEFGMLPVDRSDFEYVAFGDVAFYGSFARAGLCLVEQPDVIADYWFEGNGIDIFINGEPMTMEDLSDCRAFMAGEVSEDDYSNRYADYFHGDVGLVELHNDKAKGGTLLIVADSFSNPIERYFALNYRHVYVLDPRHNDVKADALIAEHEVNDVLILFSKKTIVFEEMLGALSAE